MTLSVVSGDDLDRVWHQNQVKSKTETPSIRQPSLKMADRIEGLRTKHSKKIHGNWACALVSNLSNNDSDWFCFNVHHETRLSCHDVYHASSRHALYRDPAHVYYCAHFWNGLFIISRIWAPSHGPCRKWGLWMESVQSRVHDPILMSNF